MDHSMPGKKAALDIVQYPRAYHPDRVQRVVRFGEGGSAPRGGQRIFEPQEFGGRIPRHGQRCVAGYLPGRADVDRAVLGAKAQFDVIQTQLGPAVREQSASIGRMRILVRRGGDGGTTQSG